MEADQVPKYLNSPETPIYSKGRTLYGLNVTKTAIRQQGRAVLVEGYFDFAMAIQGGVTAVVASSGTALTQPQAQLLRRFASRVVLSFDPDAAGQGAAVRSCDLLVREGLRGQRRAAAAGPRSRPGGARGRRRGVSGDRRPGAAVSRLPRRSRGEGARHGDAGRTPRVPERDAGGGRVDPGGGGPRPVRGSAVAAGRHQRGRGPRRDPQGGGGPQDHRPDRRGRCRGRS